MGVCIQPKPPIQAGWSRFAPRATSPSLFIPTMKISLPFRDELSETIHETNLENEISLYTIPYDQLNLRVCLFKQTGWNC